MPFLEWGGGTSEILHFYKLGWLFPYFLLGHICSKYEKIGAALHRLSSGWYLLLLAFIYGITVAWCYNWEAFAEFYGGFHCVLAHSGYYALFYLTGVCGIVLVFLAADVCKSAGQLTAWLGTYSLDIYVMHSFFVRLFQKLTVLCHISNGLLYGLAVLAWSAFTAVALAFLSKQILHKWKLYRISVGGR